MRHVESIRDPAGDIQTFDPRPRPATWTVAVAVKPFGRRERSLVFLIERLARIQRTRLLKYFSNIVLVLVTTSPYISTLPNSSASLDPSC